VHSRKGAIVAGGHRQGGELVVLEAHQAQLAADARAHVQGAVERIAVEDPAKGHQFVTSFDHFTEGW